MKSKVRFFTIHKYTLQIGVRNLIKIPTQGKVLGAQIQRGVLVIWVKFFVDDKESIRSFLVLPTGAECAEEANEVLVHIETVQYGEYVWHVFESVPQKQPQTRLPA